MHNPRHDPQKVHRNRAERSSDCQLAFWLKHNLLDRPEARPYLVEAADRILKYRRWLLQRIIAFWTMVMILSGWLIGDMLRLAGFFG